MSSTWHDHANRLVGVSGTGLSAIYSYNGLGDRLRQTANSVTTEYVLDLASGLTQVLSDETNAYLYGVGRIGEQQPDGWQYYLGDALGSVRQLTDEAGEIILVKSYLPLGEARLKPQMQRDWREMVSQLRVMVQ